MQGGQGDRNECRPFLLAVLASWALLAGPCDQFPRSDHWWGCPAVNQHLHEVRREVAADDWLPCALPTAAADISTPVAPLQPKRGEAPACVSYAVAALDRAWHCAWWHLGVACACADRLPLTLPAVVSASRPARGTS